ncbi:unnamed protein product [Caenorhabditis angaria]|uniref:Uncharacterized protein n=1 Tax=Caenorhabditis angaria TaxID=860376 RepID=A0A9P1N855_9PELO|nr:unnamed protein product [Caenorhabditis angaria]
MIFEIPIDRLEAMKSVPSRTPGVMVLQRKAEREVIQAISEAQTTPSVRPFSFSTSARQFQPPPLKRAFTSPVLQVQNLSRKSSSSSRTNSITDLFKNLRVQATALQATVSVSMQQLA